MKRRGVLFPSLSFLFLLETFQEGHTWLELDLGRKLRRSVWAEKTASKTRRRSGEPNRWAPGE